MTETFLAAVNIRRVSLEIIAEMYVFFRINVPCFWPKFSLTADSLVNFSNIKLYENLFRVHGVVYFFYCRCYNFNSLNVLAFSTYNFKFLRSRMQLVQFFFSVFYVIPYVIFSSVLWSP
jgi:hypothetical protein